jgi:hypothetical protein
VGPSATGPDGTGGVAAPLEEQAALRAATVTRANVATRRFKSVSSVMRR